MEQRTSDFSKTAMEDESQVLRRKDIVALGETFTEALSPLKRILKEMKLQNYNTSLTGKHVRRLVWWMTFLSLGYIYGSYVDHRNITATEETLEKQRVQQQENREMQRDLEKTNAELRELLSLVKATKKTVEDVKEDQDTKPQIDIVPEEDPIKARRAPVKLRVRPPVRVERKGSSYPHKKPVPSKQSVEIPIPSKHF